VPQPPTTWPAACSPLVADVVGGSARPARVLASFPTALYLATGRHEEVVPVLAHDALALPTGVRLPRRSCQIDWQVTAGDTVQIGDGRVCLPGATVVSVRMARPARVMRHPGVRDMTGPATALSGACVNPALVFLTTDLVRLALSGREVARAVTALVGAGAGLTPSGDDALCGVLLGLRAVGAADAHRRVADTVRARTRGTTSLSASLLVAAIEGYAVPDVVRLVTLLTTPTAGPSGRNDASEPARIGSLPSSIRPVDPPVRGTLERVLAIGHSSGADLVAGLAGTFIALHDTSVTNGHADVPANMEGARRA
jgi:hypothetical protein